MEVKSCKKCRRLFNYLGGMYLCPECKDALERSFLEVKDYIRENPKNSIQQISEATGVDGNQIKDWIKEGRLELSKGSPITISCEKCGASILRGRYCDACNQKLANNLNALVAADTKARREAAAARRKAEAGPKMRFKKS